MKEKKKIIVEILIFIAILIIISYVYNSFINIKYSDYNIDNKEESEKMEILKITNSNYSEEVEKTDKLVLIDFWASWCGPCRMMSPIVDEIAKEVSEQIKVGKVNVDEEADLAVKFNISSIPTLVIIKDGKVVKTLIGVQSKKTIIDALNQELAQ